MLYFLNTVPQKLAKPVYTRSVSMETNISVAKIYLVATVICWCPHVSTAPWMGSPKPL